MIALLVGMQFFFRKDLNFNLEIVTCHDSFILVSMEAGSTHLGLANIYMPYDNQRANSIAEYLQVLGELHAAINSLNTDKILLFEDFNADPRKGRLWRYLSDFVNKYNFVIWDIDQLPFNSFTYLSPSHNSCSWPDHAICSNSVDIRSVDIFYGLTFYDHFSIYIVKFKYGLHSKY